MLQSGTQWAGEQSPNPVVWEETACPLCAGSNHGPLLEAPDALGAGQFFLIVRCADCGLTFTNPRPDIASMAHFYPDDYHCFQGRDLSKPQRKADPLATLVPLQGERRLLDFGCGAGGFLLRMQALGWQVTGLDRAPASVARLQALDLRSFVGSLPHPDLRAERFDAITMWQSLEHVHQPLEVLRSARDLLATGGRLLVATPNFAGLGARWFGAHWYGLDLPRHLTHFTPSTLQAMLARVGFADIELRQQQHPSWLRHSAARAGQTMLRTHFASGLAGWWGRCTGRSEALLALARK